MDKIAVQQQALNNAQSGESHKNYAAILSGFVCKGIPASEILPRVNVFTYNAWLAKGRQVLRGQHGVKVVTWIDKPDGGKRPITATVFHVSQTSECDSRDNPVAFAPSVAPVATPATVTPIRKPVTPQLPPPLPMPAYVPSKPVVPPTKKVVF